VPRTRSGPEPTVSVIVPARNAEATVADCLDALLAGDYPEDRREILVVDNGSTDRTAPLAAARPVRCVAEPRPGVSNARNRGIAQSQGELVAFLDADCIPEPRWLAELVRPFEDAAVGIVAGRLEHQPASTAAERQAARMLGDWQRFAVSSQPPYVVTANAAFRRTVLERIGGFDPHLTRAQDVELGFRLVALSPRCGIAYGDEAIARHRHHSTQFGFLRQQLGWAYGAGLVEAKHGGRNGRASEPPGLGEIGRTARGLGLVLAARARGEGRPEHLEEAWFNLLHRIAWWAGARAGMVRGARIWPRRSSAATAAPR
jgi:cellulose synthase/poly-beta-1,6-N-acetylglucosamine synthase-like glycosyltransferase